MLNCWWFAFNFRWRSSPILFQFCRLSLPRCSLFSCIVGVFTNICCWSLKSAKRFSIASNCKNKTKQNKTKHEIKTGTKKTGELKLDRTEKNQILNCSQYCNLQSFYKDQFWQKSVLQSDDARKIVMSFVTRLLQALTISYLIDSKRCIFGTIMANKFKCSFF